MPLGSGLEMEKYLALAFVDVNSQLWLTPAIVRTPALRDPCPSGPRNTNRLFLFLLVMEFYHSERKVTDTVTFFRAGTKCLPETMSSRKGCRKSSHLTSRLHRKPPGAVHSHWGFFPHRGPTFPRFAAPLQTVPPFKHSDRKPMGKRSHSSHNTLKGTF